MLAMVAVEICAFGIGHGRFLWLPRQGTGRPVNEALLERVDALAISFYYLRMLIYLVTNRVDGKKYIGVTSRLLPARWREHVADAQNGRGWALHDAIRAHGADAFDVVLLESVADWQTACGREQHFIVECGCLAPAGYNLTWGGEGTPGRKHSDETKAKISAAHKGKKLSTEHRRKLSAAKQGKKMPKRTAAHSAKISAGLKRAWARRKARQ